MVIYAAEIRLSSFFEHEQSTLKTGCKFTLQNVLISCNCDGSILINKNIIVKRGLSFTGNNFAVNETTHLGLNQTNRQGRVLMRGGLWTCLLRKHYSP